MIIPQSLQTIQPIYFHAMVCLTRALFYIKSLFSAGGSWSLGSNTLYSINSKIFPFRKKTNCWKISWNGTLPFGFIRILIKCCIFHQTKSPSSRRVSDWWLTELSLRRDPAWSSEWIIYHGVPFFSSIPWFSCHSAKFTLRTLPEWPTCPLILGPCHSFIHHSFINSKQPDFIF